MKNLKIGVSNLSKRLLFISLLVLVLGACKKQDANDKKVWAWMSGKTTLTATEWDHYFKEASNAGIDAILLECHGGYPEVLGDSTSYRDSAAIYIIKTALPYSQKYNIELHAWIWTINRTEMSLRNSHPEWYQVNALGESCLDIKLYNREHYRWLCPSRPTTIEYLKDRVDELAQIDGLAGIHLDFIRFPDAILPYGLHESRQVVQDRVYPLWDFCYCEVCRSNFKEMNGLDPLELEDPTSNLDWMQYRWDALANVASEVALEIKKQGKISSVAVFATPEESKKLVRQDWANFKNVDIFFPMIYHKFYGWEDASVLTATQEGVQALSLSRANALSQDGKGSVSQDGKGPVSQDGKGSVSQDGKGSVSQDGNVGYLCSGLFIGHVPIDRISEFFNYAQSGGSKGVALFSLEGIDKTPGYWEKLKEAIAEYKN